MLWKTFLGTDIKSQEAQQHEQVKQLPALPLHMASYSRIAIWSRIIEDELTKFRLDILEFCCHMLTRIWPQTMSCLAKLHDEFWCIDVNWKNWSMVHGAICNWWIHPRTHMNLRYLLHLATPFRLWHVVSPAQHQLDGVLHNLLFCRSSSQLICCLTCHHAETLQQSVQSFCDLAEAVHNL